MRHNNTSKSYLGQTLVSEIATVEEITNQGNQRGHRVHKNHLPVLNIHAKEVGVHDIRGVGHDCAAHHKDDEWPKRLADTDVDVVHTLEDDLEGENNRLLEGLDDEERGGGDTE